MSDGINTIRQVLADNLSLFLTEKGITQKELADNLNVTEGAVTHWVNGSNSPKLEKIIELCIKYRLSFDNMILKELTTFEIDAKKEQLIANYELLNSEAQDDLVDFSKLLVSKAKNLKSTAASDKETVKDA